MNYKKIAAWLGKAAATAVLVSFLSILTTGYIVTSYVEVLLKQFHIPVQVQPLSMSGVWGKLWGADTPSGTSIPAMALEPQATMEPTEGTAGSGGGDEGNTYGASENSGTPEAGSLSDGALSSGAGNWSSGDAGMPPPTGSDDTGSGTGVGAGGGSSSGADSQNSGSAENGVGAENGAIPGSASGEAPSSGDLPSATLAPIPNNSPSTGTSNDGVRSEGSSGDPSPENSSSLGSSPTNM